MAQSETIDNSLSRIGQGCWGIGGEFKKTPSTAVQHLASLQAGIDAGLTFLDTAEVYAEGFSEELVGRAIAGRRDEVFVASKFSPENSTFDRVISSAEASLRRLKTDYLDLYQIHWPNPSVPIAETMGALEKLVDEGKIRHIGVSNFTNQEFRAAQEATRHKIFSNQVEYNLYDRFIEASILPFCSENGVKVIAYSPLNKGKSVWNPQSRRVLESIAERHEVTIEQIQLSWLASRKNVIPIPKSSNIQRIKENAGALSLQLNAEDQGSIDKLCRTPVVRVAPAEVEVSASGEGNRPVYQTLQEALDNPLGLTPSPSILAEALTAGEPLKPVRLRINHKSKPSSKYELIEGRLRYWASVIAFGEDYPLPALLTE